MTSYRLRLCAFALLVVLALAPAAAARPLCEGSPDACDLNAAARGLQHIHGSGHSLAPEIYSASAPLHRSGATDGGTPWLDIGLGVGSAFAIAGVVGFAVRSRQRIARVRIS